MGIAINRRVRRFFNLVAFRGVAAGYVFTQAGLAAIRDWKVCVFITDVDIRIRNGKDLIGLFIGFNTGIDRGVGEHIEGFCLPSFAWNGCDVFI